MAALKGRRWRELCAWLRNSTDQHLCWRCRKPIDLDLPPRHRLSFSVHHIVPRSRGGAVYDRRNVAACHYGCNSSMGNRPLQTKPRRMTRDWR